MPSVYIGISGWTYPVWRGVFYPAGLVHRKELEYASRKVNSIEINGSFYSLQSPNSYKRWFEETPPHFVFAVKASRFISHMKKLKDVQIPLANFFASGVLRLAGKLGAFLWQFPATFAFDEERFESFLQLLPKDTKEAAGLASLHDERMEGRQWIEAQHQAKLRYAFEVRHPSFFVPAFTRLLKRYQAARSSRTLPVPGLTRKR